MKAHNDSKVNRYCFFIGGNYVLGLKTIELVKRYDIDNAFGKKRCLNLMYIITSISYQ